MTPPHSMEPRERALALEVLAAAWPRIADGASILAAVRAEAADLPRRYPDVSADS